MKDAWGTVPHLGGGPYNNRLYHRHRGPASLQRAGLERRAQGLNRPAGSHFRIGAKLTGLNPPILTTPDRFSLPAWPVTCFTEMRTQRNT